MNKLLTSILMLLTFVSLTAATPAKVQGDTVTVATKNLSSPMKVLVVQPSQAFDNPEKRFPVVYMLNGYSGDYSSWSKTQPALDSLATAYGMILVCPDGRDSWYWDSPVDPGMQMESFFIEDLIPFIDANYPTIKKKEQRAITGLSMGGHGAMWLAMRHPDIFGNVGSMSGGVDIRPFPKSWKMKDRLGEYDANKDVWESHTVAVLAENLDKDKVKLNIIFDCGTSDMFAKVNDQLHQTLMQKGIPHDYISRPGGHSHPYWRNSILYHLLYFNSKFNQSK